MRVWPKLFLLFCLWPMVCPAGPWLREEGAGFFSASTLMNENLSADHSLYIEYGLRPKLTLGAKVEARTALQRFEDPSYVIFLRQPLNNEDGKLLFAYDLGVGQRDKQTFLRLGFSLGRGIKWGKRYGWAVLDTSLDLGRDPLFKADATLGLTLNDRWKAMAQLFATQTDGSTDLTLAPSVVWTPKGSKTSYQLGLEFAKDQNAIRLGLWRDF